MAVRRTKLPQDGTVERLYADGLSCQAIAQKYNCHDEAVRGFLKRRGIQRRDHGGAKFGPVRTAQRTFMQEKIPTQEVAEQYAAGSTVTELAERFGVSTPSICARLRAAGVQMRRSFFGSEMPYRCDDGHLVRSRYEQAVCNWLWHRNVAHAYEPPLPFSNRQHADFLAHGVYIEMWGIAKSAKYDARRRVKLAAYLTAGLAVVSLYPRHLNDLDRYLGQSLLQAS